MRFIALALSLAVLTFAGTKPKVRAVTAFVAIDQKQYSSQLEDAVRFLNTAREAYRNAGFEVESIRIATQPFPQYTRGLSHDAALAMLGSMGAIAAKSGFGLSIGPAMLKDSDDPASVEVLADLLSGETRINASLVIADEDGIHWSSVRQSARLIKTVARRSKHSQGNLSFAAIAMLKSYGPFFPGAYHLGSGHAFAVGLEGANIVEEVFAKDHDPRTAEKNLLAALTQHFGEAEKVATGIASNSGWTYAGIDPTPAPLGEVSIGRAIESFTGAPFGAPGTLTAAAIITRAVQAVPIKRVGYAGLMIPVLEDALLARRWEERTYTMDSLLAYSAVCAGGLDTVPLPGDISEERIAGILSDVASLAYKWHKPLAARLLPVAGKKAGERTEFNDPRMANTTIQ